METFEFMAPDFVHTDTRHAVIGKLVRQLHIDTVVHMAVKVDSHGDDRTVHETNVIGTMNVLTGCAGPSSPVRRLVVKSSQAVYGASPAYPSFVTEEVAGSDRHAYGLKRDLLDIEQLAQEFSLRTPGCRVCILRLGYRVSEGTTLGQYLSLPIVPTFAGFDPRLQLLHEDDAAEAVVRSALNDHEGVFNVAGDGIVLLSQAIGIMGGRPVLRPLDRTACDASYRRRPPGPPRRGAHIRVGRRLLQADANLQVEARLHHASGDGQPRARQRCRGDRFSIAAAGI